ncbi:mitochondrial phosphatidic acid transfer protein Ups1 [Schizosaccharomyces osmophilus]|uniref:Mitochondrial phosphatidic acid transfer protein Ups1 n=1 Tax=Schizosaccharomyces osmophilus TaxID=2545709 RepID=A0AAE9WDS9_9SCHI|nr:mitochondrial phosphatidic acid transfer protein Ups1 [Schizosaccharomyces osmophilus]WBW72863.1 mitochondrial phosphatidic acid transfer protein Ups1 [Schizosaccharomyces osmophilus]
MSVCKDESEFDAPWEKVSSAWLRRYPNPYSSHVVSSDVLERYIDEKGRLHTERLLVKQGRVPRWASEFLNVSRSYILERSIIDANKRELLSETFNIDHLKLLKAMEYNRYQPSEEDSSKTSITTLAQFASPLRLGLGRRVQKYCLKRFPEQLIGSRRGVLYVLQKQKSIS